MRKTATLVGISLTLVVVGAIWGLSKTVPLPEALVDVLVEDHMGHPVTGATVNVSGALSDSDGEARTGLTDTTGRLHVQIRTNGTVTCNAQLDGSYCTQGITYNYRDIAGAMDQAFTTGQWHPRNVTLKVRLNKIVKPVAMYARRVRRGLPATGQSIGFDFEQGDFVSPYGKGRNADIILRAETKDKSRDEYDYSLKVAFPNKLDGLIPLTMERSPAGSALRSPYEAPLDGFVPTWLIRRQRIAGAGEVSNYDPERHGYLVRVRSEADESGNLIKANYGKIYGDFMNFVYYLNPTPNDRNVEFDPKNNLFTDLAPQEQVAAP